MNEKDSLLEGKSIIVKNNVIEDIVDSTEEFESSDVEFVDVRQRAIVPGFIDAHNHLVWAGDRFNEHRLRMEGKTYADIANMGGVSCELSIQLEMLQMNSCILLVCND